MKHLFKSKKPRLPVDVVRHTSASLLCLHSGGDDCFSHIGKNETEQVQLLVISSEGASGDYPGCTDKAYSKAISDGVDVLDCPVQMTNDGIPFCLGSINLRDRTNVDETNFSNLATSNPDLNIDSGIYTYNLTWSQIQRTLRPAINNPFANYSLFRNTKARNDGNFMQLSDFLAIASNASSVSGVLISIENAAYLAEKQGLGVTDAVLDALSKAGYNNQSAKKIMIKSSDSAVLKKFKSSSDYELVYMVDEDISDITNSAISGIKNFASSVVITKKSVFPTDKAFFTRLTAQTSVVPKLQAFGFSVYVQIFINEFVSQPWDFSSDPYVEINTHFSCMEINGVVTDFPATAAKYKRNRCLGYKDIPIYMRPVLTGSLISLVTQQYLPPALAPNPILSVNDVFEPPLPPRHGEAPPNHEHRQWLYSTRSHPTKWTAYNCCKHDPK
ncbi:Glycerophosphodiester phosphodiesterase GDPDL4 [Abeliophyllum distichum]|uniref:glycerophosphodiester phosphodiesterase n=1 Tax=Abeliophyllum distichum TaxID=126358 RepID=A0ABD1PSU7_9LAMI